MIPLGFHDIKKNILRENVMYYEGYFEVSFEKNYPEKFDNMTMFKWMDFTANNLKENVTAFYGIYDQNFETEFSLDEVLYSKTVIFRDGVGLSNNSNLFNFYYLIAIIYMIIVCNI